MKHEYDSDAACIHCGHDGAEEHHLRTHGHAYLERVPCPVWNEDTRAENRRRYPLHDPHGISESEMLDAECDFDDYVEPPYMLWLVTFEHGEQQIVFTTATEDAVRRGAMRARPDGVIKSIERHASPVCLWRKV